MSTLYQNNLMIYITDNLLWKTYYVKDYDIEHPNIYINYLKLIKKCI